MRLSDDPGGRSGVFPRIDLVPPAPAPVDAPAPQPRPAPADPDIQAGDLPVSAEGEDRTHDEADASPDADAP